VYRFYFNHEYPILASSGVVALLLLWHSVTSTGIVDRLILVPPWEVVVAAYALFASGEIWPHINMSVLEFGLGFSLAVGFGVFLGLLMGWYRKVGFSLDFIVSGLTATPRIVLVPVLILWLGVLGPLHTAGAVFISAFIPVVVSTLAGVRSVDESLIRMSRSFVASDWDIFRTVVIRSSLPSIIAGVRLAIGAGLLGIIVGDLFASQAGLGYLLLYYTSIFQPSNMLAVAMILVLTGVVLTEAARRVEKRYRYK